MEYVFYVVLAPFAAGVLMIATLASWKYKAQPAAQTLLWYMGVVAALLLSNTFELISSDERGTVFWASINHIFLTAVPITWYAFAKRYAKPESHFPAPETWWFVGISAIYVTMVQTNRWHGLIWEEIIFLRIEGFLTMRGEYGSVFWVAAAYHYALSAVGLWYIVRSALRHNRLYSRQARWIALAAVTPFLFNLAYVFRAFPFLRKDYTPLTLAFSAGAAFVGIHWFRLFQATPVARDLIFKDFRAALLVVDPERHLVDFNPVARSLFALESNMLGLDLESIVRVEKVVGGLPIDQRLRTSRTVQWNREPIELDIQIVPIQRGQGASSGALVTAYDVTSWVRLVQERDRALEDAHMATQRRQEMQMQMYQQEKLAALGQLAANVAHEINNPLSFLQSNVMALGHYISNIDMDDPMLKEEINLAIADSEEGIDRIQTVTSTLLSLSRPSQQEQEHCDINVIVERSLVVANPQIRRVATIRRELASISQARCYPTEIAQVVLNILLNAVQAIESDVHGASRPNAPFHSGENAGAIGSITVKTYEDDDNVYCSIANSGPLIPEDERERIFEPFFTTKMSGRGTGLGLSLSKEIIERRHGGRLTVADTAETMFVIELPK